MTTARAARALATVDVRSVARDPMLRWLLALPIAVGLLFRWGLPPLAQLATARLSIDLLRYEVLILSSMVLVMPAIVGVVTGFLLLDLEDDGTLAALRVTPLSLSGYLTYRLGGPMLLAGLTTWAMLELSGRAPLSVPALLAVALCAAPIAPAYALFLGAFAADKVQGFALMKAVGPIGIPPILAWWVREPWQWLFGLDPYYWPVKLYWILARGDQGAVAALAAGLGVQGLLVWWLWRRFLRTASG